VQEAAEQILIDGGLLGEGDLRRAREVAQTMDAPVHSTLVRLGLVGEEAMADALSSALSLPRLADADVPAAPVLPELLGENFLRTCRLLPLSAGESGLVVAMADPLDRETLRAVEMQVGRPVRIRVATATTIQSHLDRLFGEQLHGLAAPDGETAVHTAEIEALHDQASDAPTVRLLSQLIDQAVAARASDIHLEPDTEGVRVRYRIDGLLRVLRHLPAQRQAALASRVKIMAGLDIVERRRPQDGRARQVVEGRHIDMRISCLPTSHGESVVIRLLDQARAPLDLADLGLSGQLRERLAGALDRGNGIVLATGPTGSGKTTALYAAMQRFNEPSRKIVTVEDPVEYDMPGFSQIQVRPEIGLGFSNVLRSVLRHDPDILMVGEIRDAATAEIAVQAALTGHLVLSTLHTNDAPGALTRLADMGLAPYQITAAVTAVMGQRLLRTLCPVCRRPAADGAVMLADMGHRPIEGAPTPAIFEAAGCERCGGTGYEGRVAVAEIMLIDENIRRLVMNHAGHEALVEAARTGGMRPVLQDALDKVAAGQTSLAEVSRVLGAGP
jgi:general secretion pathway protein E